MGVLATLKALYGGDNAIPSAREALLSAQTYAEYEKAALLLDFLEGRNAWKAESLSPDSDSFLISARYAQLREARLTEDFDRMLFLLRTTLSRNLGGMGSAKLYSYTHIGTKHRIEEYIAEVQSSFKFLLDATKKMHQDETQEVLNNLLKTRQSFGRTALLLSGGGTLGMMHIGVIKTLFDDKLLPRIISGSSAGAIVAAIVCTQTDEEIPGLVERFPYGNLQVFELESDPESIFTRLARFLKHGVVMDIRYLHNVMAEWMGNMTFSEAFNKTRRILNITVSSSSIYEMPRLLNYITSPNVIIWSAVAASCSIPFVFAGSPLLSKDPKTGEPVVWDASSSKCIDGSIEGDLPTARLSELFNVNHFIVSQVNPHVTPWLPTTSHELASSAGTPLTIMVNELLHVAEVFIALGIVPAVAKRLSGLLNQRYIGDITILPHTPLLPGLYKVLKNPTPKFMLDSMYKGERATWPRMSLIRNHLRIETTIDNTLYELRLALVQHHRPTRWLKTSQSQSNLDVGKLPRKRSNSIVSNTSIEIEPFDIAIPRDPRTKSQPTTPGFEKSPFTWDNKSFTAISSRKQSRRGSYDAAMTPVQILVNKESAGTDSPVESTTAFARAIDQKLVSYGYQSGYISSRPQSPQDITHNPFTFSNGGKSPAKSGARSPAMQRLDTRPISRKVSFDGIMIEPRYNS